MNVRQQLYKKYRLEGYSRYAAARKAGYAHSTALKARVNVEKRIGFDKTLEVMGLTDNALARHAWAGLNANKIISANITYGDADEKTNDFIEVPDWTVRHKYFSTILKLQNKLQDKFLYEEPKQDYTQINIIIEGERNTPSALQTGKSVQESIEIPSAGSWAKVRQDDTGSNGVVS